MDEEGIMALEPRPMDQMNNAPAMSPEESISYGEAYGATKSAVRQYHPEIADQYEAAIQEMLAEVGTMTAEELDAFRDLIEYIEKNKDRYPQVIAELVAQDIIDEGDFPPEYSEEFMAVLRAVVEEAYQRGMAVQLPPMQQFAMGGIASVAEGLRQQGRFGDTMLAHITPQEASMLKAMGGSGTINPVTGLPEFFLKKIFKGIKKVVKSVVKVAKKVLDNPIGRIVGTIALTPFVGPVAAGAIVGGITGGVKGAILGGIGGYVSGAGFMDSALGSSIGKGLVSTLGDVGAKFAIQTATGTAMGLLGGAKLGDAVKGGVAGAALQYAMNRGVPKGQEAPIEDRSLAATATPSRSMAQTGSAMPQSTALPSITSPIGQSFSPTSPMVTPTSASVIPTNVTGQPFTPSQSIISNAAQYQPLSSQIDMAARTATAPAASTIPSFMRTAQASIPGVLGGQTGAAAAAPAPTDFSFSRLTKEPLSYAKDVYSTYLSPSRESVSADTGLIEKYGPLTAAGIGAMYLGGGFETQPAQAPGLMQKETGTDFLRQAPNLFYTQNIPGVVYGPRGEITGVNPLLARSPVTNPLLRTEDVLAGRFNRGGIADLSRRYPRMNGQISGPGTEKSDSIPAMLSDGEFVMTARAVRGMGNGSRREGAKRMYKLMSALEQNATGKA